MPSLWFVVPVHGRLPLASICLRQLRRTCDALTENGIEATAVVVADRENLRELRRRLSNAAPGPTLGFGTVERDNMYLSARFNDGIQLAIDRPLLRQRQPTHGEYVVSGRRVYRGHPPGERFTADLDRSAEQRAIYRGDIKLLRRTAPGLAAGSYRLPAGWDAHRAADYVVPCGSDDWVDHRILLDLPDARTVLGFQHISFVREDGREMVARHLNYPGGSGIRVYPRQILKATRDCRPADEDRKRACDTSILTNARVAHGDRIRITHRDIDPRQIVDWKSPGQQLNTYDDVRQHRAENAYDDPFDALADIFPRESLREMRAHYARSHTRQAVLA